MKAVILSGGKGTRLRPLTDKKPKPLVTVGDRRILETIIENLSKNSITEAAITLGYRGDDIKNALGDEFCGVKLHYFEEKEPLGTAGAIRNCKDFLDSDFIVLSGDALCDIDTEPLISSHRMKGALATMVLTPCEEPLEYGVVLLEKDSTVRAFSEKPSWEGVKSDLVNCGIYVFKKEFIDLIPENTFCDLSSDIFPEMLKKNLPINTYVTRSFWCDVGSFWALYSCNMKSLSKNFFSHYIPRNVKVSKEAKVRDSVIGENSIIEKDSKITRAVVGRECHVGEGAQITGAILGDRVKIGKDVKIGKGAVVGDDSYIADGHTVGEGKRLACDTRIESDGVSDSFCAGAKLFLRAEFVFDISSPEQAFLLGRAASVLGKEIGTLHTAAQGAHLAAESFALGVAWSGSDCVVFTDSTPEDSAFLSGYFSMPVFSFYERENSVCALAFSQSSLPLSHEEERKVVLAFERPPRASAQGYIRYFDGADIAKKQHFKKLLGTSKPSNTNVGIKRNESGEKFLEYAGEDLAHLCKNSFAEDFFIEISPDRKDVSLSFGRVALDTAHTHALILKSLISNGQTVFHLPNSAPTAFNVIAEAQGAKIVRTNQNRSFENADVFPDLWQRDALFASALLYKVLCEHSFSREKLERTIDSLPVFLCVEKDLNTHGIPVGRLMRELEKKSSTKEDCGVTLSRGMGKVRITPDSRESFKILAEAQNSEYAEELCDFAENLINEISQNNEG